MLYHRLRRVQHSTQQPPQSGSHLLQHTAAQQLEEKPRSPEASELQTPSAEYPQFDFSRIPVTNGDRPTTQPLHTMRPNFDFSRISGTGGDRPIIQPKLRIGAIGDRYEQEADRVAAQVVEQLNTPESTQSPEASQSHKTDESLQMKPALSNPSGELSTSPELEAEIGRSRGGGRPLAENVRRPMEQAFGTDFSRVKVHTDAQSHQLNQQLGSRAFTSGQNLFFDQHEYQPESRKGQEVLAHELSHVIQQQGISANQNYSKSSIQAPLSHQVSTPLSFLKVPLGIQRKLKKMSKSANGNWSAARDGSVYSKFPSQQLKDWAKDTGKALSREIIEQLEELHQVATPYSFSAAYAEALKNIKTLPRKVTGRGGKRLLTTKDIVEVMRTSGVDVTQAKAYLKSKEGLVNAQLNEMETTDTDFAHINSTYTANQATEQVKRVLIGQPAALIRTGSAFGELVDASRGVNTVGSGVISAYTGNQFEEWCQTNFPAHGFGKREAFAQTGTMKQNRSSDGYDATNKVLWDCKVYSGKVGTDQAEDYVYIVKNSVNSLNGKTASKISYLFHDENIAKLNHPHLKGVDKSIGVFYVKTGMPPDIVEIP